MIKKTLCIIGGILSIISVFLPVITITHIEGYEGHIIYYWMFGQFMYNKEGEILFWFKYLDILGTLFLMSIIVGAMLVILNADEESKIGIIGGSLIVVSMALFFLIISAKNMNSLIHSDIEVYYVWYMIFEPSYGFYTALIGGIISIGGSLIPNKKNKITE